MPHVFNPHSFRKLDNPERRKLLPAKKLLKQFGLRAGHTLVDIGAGIGYFAIPAASIVGPRGKVIAVDGSREMLGMLEKRASARKKKFEIRKAGATATKLSRGIADIVLMAFVLHEIGNKPAALREARRILKPGGRLAIIEWVKRQTTQGPPTYDRIGVAEARELLKRAGCLKMATGKINRHHYFIIAGK